MTVKECWDSLPPEARRWLLENPGSVVLPRTLANTVNTAAGAELATDAHGEAALSREDQEFIRHKTHTARTRTEAGSGTPRSLGQRRQGRATSGL